MTRYAFRIGLLVVAVILLGAGLFFRDSILDAWWGFTHKAEAGVRIVSDPRGEAVYVFNDKGLHAVPKDGNGETLEYAAGANGNSFQIIRAPSGAVELVRNGRKGADPLVQGIDDKSGLVVSSDGTTAAFSEYADDFATGKRRWSVRIADIATGGVTPVGPGFSPQFFTRDGKEYLFYLSGEGATVVDLAAGESRTAFLPVISDIRSVAAVSHDGAFLVIQDPLTYLYTVYQIDSVYPLSITPKKILDAPLASVGFYGGQMYGVTYGDTQSLVSYDTSDWNQSIVATLPDYKVAFYLLP